MKFLRKLYRILFERGCQDFSQPYVETKTDSGFSKWDTPASVSYKPVNINYYPVDNGVSGYITVWDTKANTWFPSTIGYHNSRL